MYLSATLVAIHDGDPERLKVESQGSEIRVLFEHSSQHTFSQTLILSRSNARELVNRLADVLEETGCCELCHATTQTVTR